MIIKIVFDTNVLISATLWEDSVAQKFLFKCIRENVQIFSSREIIEEYKEILARDFDYKEQEIREVLETVLQFMTLIIPIKKIDIVKEDIDDNKIIECAVESKAEYRGWILVQRSAKPKNPKSSGVKSKMGAGESNINCVVVSDRKLYKYVI